MDNHKIFLVVVVGGGGAEGLGWDLPEVESPIGCQDKFHHIVKKKNLIGSARIACLCLYERCACDFQNFKNILGTLLRVKFVLYFLFKKLIKRHPFRAEPPRIAPCREYLLLPS